MSKLNTTSELELVMDAVFRSIALQELDLPDEFFPAHLSVALIDAISGRQNRNRELSMPPVAVATETSGNSTISSNVKVSPSRETWSDLIRSGRWTSRVRRDCVST